MTTVSVTDLTNAKTDVDHIAAIATSTALTATDRLGTTKKTLQGAINSISAITDRGAWVTATAYAVKDIVLDTGVYYICITAHTSGATFAGDAAKWRVYQGDLGTYHSVDVVNDIRSNDFSSRKMIRIATERGNPVYYLDSADTTSVDDDFLVIVDAGGNRWKLDINSSTVILAEWAGLTEGGVVDNYTALQKFANAIAGRTGAMLPKIYYSSQPIVFPDNCNLITGYVPAFPVVSSNPSVCTLVFDLNHAQAVTFGNYCGIMGLRVKGSGGLDGDYAFGNYIASSSNPVIGIKTGAGCHVQMCDVFQVVTGIDAGGQSEIRNSTVSYCQTGAKCGADGAIIDSNFSLCSDYGIDTNGSYLRIIGNRIEQGGGYGILADSGEVTIVANVFDHNALAGVYFKDAWGGTLAGNYFARNGAGGDGTKGRFTQSVPGHKSYIEVKSQESVHVKIKNAKDIAIAGNRYRYGNNDSADGSIAPAHIYQIDSVTGNNAVPIAGDAHLLGWYSSYPLVTAGDTLGVFVTSTGYIKPINIINDRPTEFRSSTASDRALLMLDPNLNTGDRVLGGVFIGSSAVDDTHCGLHVDTVGGSDSFKVVAFRHQHPTRGREDFCRISYNGDFETTTHAYDRGRLKLGSNYLWVDATGDLRIKSGAAPTSDTDGTIVGTQS